MKVIQIMPEFGLAGAEIMCENLVYELIRLGHDVTVISMYNYHSPITERLEGAGVDIRYLDKKPGIDISMIPKMKRLFGEIRADVIHTHRFCAQYAMPAAILAGVRRRVHTVHNVAEKENIKFARMLNKVFFKHFGLVPVALSELIRTSVVDEYGIERESVPVIYNGIDLSRCIPKDNYSLNGSFKILHVGRFSEQKNHIGLLNAFAVFHAKHPNSELWLIGEGEKKADAETFIKENDLAEAVKLLGLQSDVYGYLNKADMFVLPSNYEGVPITLIEAMGTALPIVATAVGGVPDMLTDRENAFVVENDTDKIADAIEQYYTNEEMRELYGKRAKERAELFSAAVMGERYVDIYRG